MKKALSILFFIFLCAGGFSQSVEVDGIYYTLNTSDHTAAVTYYSGFYYSGDVVIPEYITYKNRPFNVTSIGNDVFRECTGLTSITIPNSVTSIGNNAFRDCTGLTSVTIPNSVTNIGYEAFQGCKGLTSVTIGSSVTDIGSRAFEGCRGLTRVNVSSLETWSKLSFYDSSSDPLQYAHHLYLNGEEITDLVIPHSVTSIGNWTFSGCYGLTSITIPNSVTRIEEHAFSNCPGLISLTIPNSVTSIGRGAFNNCTGLTSVTIPNSVTSLGDYAFSGCNNIETVVSLNPSPPSGISFPSDVYLGTLYVPVGSEFAYRNAEGWKNFYEIIEGMPDDTNKTYPLSVSASQGGSVSFLDKTVNNGSASVSVESGSEVTLTIATDEGYRLLSLKVNGNDVTADIVDGKYTIKDINEATSVVVTFEDKSIRRAKMDTNGDGNVNTADVVAIYEYIINGE